MDCIQDVDETRIKGLLKTRLGRDVYRLWFADVDFCLLDTQVIQIKTSSRFTGDYIENNYYNDILAVCRKVGLVQVIKVDFRVCTTKSKEPVSEMVCLEKWAWADICHTLQETGHAPIATLVGPHLPAIAGHTLVFHVKSNDRLAWQLTGKEAIDIEESVLTACSTHGFAVHSIEVRDPVPPDIAPESVPLPSVKRKNLTHARSHKHIANTSLFASNPKSKEGPPRFEITRAFKDAEINIAGPWRLGVFEAKVFLAALAMVGIGGREVPADTVIPDEQRWREELNLAGFTRGLSSCRLKTTRHHVLKAIGVEAPGGQDYQRLSNALKRLASVTFGYQVGTRSGRSNLMSYWLDEASDNLFITLNPLNAQAIIGSPRISWSQYDLPTLMSLSDRAMLICMRLCGYIDPGKTIDIAINLDTLAGYIWPEEARSASTRATRRKAAREALAELEGINWKINWEDARKIKGPVWITRPGSGKDTRSIADTY